MIQQHELKDLTIVTGNFQTFFIFYVFCYNTKNRNNSVTKATIVFLQGFVVCAIAHHAILMI